MGWLENCNLYLINLNILLLLGLYINISTFNCVYDSSFVKYLAT